MNIGKSIESGNLKWMIPVLNSFCLFTCIYCQQDLSTEHNVYRDYFAKTTGNSFEVYFNSIYSMSFFCMVFCNLYLGQLCDKYGGAVCLLLGNGFTFLGQFLTFASLRFDNIWVIFAGRFFLFLSQTVILMSNANLVQKHFPVTKQSLLNSIVVAFAELGMFANMSMSIYASNAFGLLMANFYMFLAACVAMVFAFTIYSFDKKYTEEPTQEAIEAQKTAAASAGSSWGNFNQTKSFWFFFCGSVFLNVVSTEFQILIPTFMHERYSYDLIKAGQMASILPLQVMLLPFMAPIIDKFRPPLYWMIPLGVLGACAIGGLLAGWFPVVFILLFGLQYNIRWGAVFPAIQDLAVPGTESKSFALIRGCRDLGGTMVSMANAFIHQEYGSYNYSMVLLIGFQLMAFIAYICSAKTVKKFNTEIQMEEAKKVGNKAQ